MISEEAQYIMNRELFLATILWIESSVEYSRLTIEIVVLGARGIIYGG
jgi:hypothetical protein